MPKSSYRKSQLSEEISHLINRFLHDELSEQFGFLSCTHVELSHDNSFAKAWISVYPPRKDFNNIDKIIGPAKQDLIMFLKKNISIKYFPHFDFVLDQSAETINILDQAIEESRVHDEI